MTKRKAIKPDTYRVLYARSGNKCAFPGCCTPIFEDNNQLTGECCHIEAYSEGGLDSMRRYQMMIRIVMII